MVVTMKTTINGAHHAASWMPAESAAKSFSSSGTLPVPALAVVEDDDAHTHTTSTTRTMTTPTTTSSSMRTSHQNPGEELDSGVTEDSIPAGIGSPQGIQEERDDVFLRIKTSRRHVEEEEEEETTSACLPLPLREHPPPLQAAPSTSHFANDDHYASPRTNPLLHSDYHEDSPITPPSPSPSLLPSSLERVTSHLHRSCLPTFTTPNRSNHVTAPCQPAVKIFFSIMHVNFGTPLFSSDHLDASETYNRVTGERKNTAPAASASHGSSSSPPREDNRSPVEHVLNEERDGPRTGNGVFLTKPSCLCGRVAPSVRGDLEVPRDVLEQITAYPTALQQRAVKLPSRFMRPSSTLNDDTSGPVVKVGAAAAAAGGGGGGGGGNDSPAQVQPARPNSSVTSVNNCSCCSVTSLGSSTGCTSLQTSSTSMPWSLRHDVLRSDDGLILGYRILLTTEWMVEVHRVSVGGMPSSSSSSSGTPSPRGGGGVREIQARPIGVTMVITTPPCGVFFRFLLNHREVLLRLLRRIVDYAHDAVPLFYHRFDQSKLLSLEARVRAASSGLEKEKITKSVWRNLKRELSAALSITKPMIYVDRPVAAALYAGVAPLGVTPLLVNTSLRWLMEKNQSYATAVVAALLSCRDFETEWDRLEALQRGAAAAALDRHSLPPSSFTSSSASALVEPYVRPARRRRRSRVVIFSTDLAMAEALLAIAAFFFGAASFTCPRRTSEAADGAEPVPSSFSQSPPPPPPPLTTTPTPVDGNVVRSQAAAAGSDPVTLTVEEEALRVSCAFERVDAAMNGSVYCSGAFGHLPVDCGIPVQWVPLPYSEPGKERLLSAFSDEEFLLVLNPEEQRCSRLRLERWTLQGPQRVTYGEKCSDPPHRFTCRVAVEEEVVADALLGAALRDLMRFWCRAERLAARMSPSSDRNISTTAMSVRVLDTLVSWLWWQAVALEERGRRLLSCDSHTRPTEENDNMKNTKDLGSTRTETEEVGCGEKRSSAPMDRESRPQAPLPLCHFFPLEEPRSLHPRSTPHPSQHLAEPGGTDTATGSAGRHAALPLRPRVPREGSPAPTDPAFAPAGRDAVLPGLTAALERRLRDECAALDSTAVPWQPRRRGVGVSASAAASVSVSSSLSWFDRLTCRLLGGSPRRSTSTSTRASLQAAPGTRGGGQQAQSTRERYSRQSQSTSIRDHHHHHHHHRDTRTTAHQHPCELSPHTAATSQFASSPPSMGLQLQRLLLGR